MADKPLPGEGRNRLADTASPYLQQHAANPVHWWPWCREALELARREDRPILLSIGYSACHWCHVMAHESFEDPATAEVMNRLFVNIKVDREERPDLDKLYQTAHQLLAQRPGGWPLTVFLMPDDHSPFFAGTYFPPTTRHGLPAFRDLLRGVYAAFHEQRPAIAEQNRALQQALERLQTDASGAVPDSRPLDEAVRQLAANYDATHGGFGAAPKFPHPDNLAFLLSRADETGDRQARDMALFTLAQMANGGINDLLGGGFCRYSVDAQWMIPHFEKMLYDNGPLLALYADAWQADGERALFRHVCERTAAWVMREMQDPDGGYYASLDADSEGEEGRFYVWDRAQVADLLDAGEYAVFAARFGLDGAANFEGRWHLHTRLDTERLAQRSGLEPQAVRRLLRSARDKLMAARAQRVRPALDDKILVSWNALMIRGMARAGRILERPDWISSAERALDFVRRVHWRDGRLLASSRQGKAGLNAYLDDYAYLIEALLELLQVRWKSADLAFALALAEVVLTRFEDPRQGGFFFTSDDHETLLQRLKPFADDAMPAGNGVLALALQSLSVLSGDPRCMAAASRTLECAWPALQKMPYAHTTLLLALQESLQPGETVIVRAAGEEAAAAWQRRLQAPRKPRRRVFAIPAAATGLPAGLAAKQPLAQGPVAYRCQGTHCDPPITDLEKLLLPGE